MSQQSQMVPIPLALIRDERLSWRARAVMMYIWSQPGTEINTQELAAAGPEGIYSVRSAMKELVAADYLVLTAKQDGQGRMLGRFYHIPVTDLSSEDPKGARSHPNSTNSGHEDMERAEDMTSFSPEERELAYSEFLALFRHKDTPQLKEIWNRLTDEDINAIQVHLESHKEVLERFNAYPSPLNYLHQRKWQNAGNQYQNQRNQLRSTPPFGA